ncbi:MAG: cytoplasmic protein [Spirochaetes bacterium GWD1_27_9]|nr:MAG: cytoplasmic protein [Spirochaetes bacterium GWB1_27_13]OHD27308.1 MAG: cytoplasmic protein [Spirochaetes bacterium GWC1_27_15]OHD34170.1 MAG: cytoplasmic protein [Spirochaetes bacterium GWD1_27_9]
MSNFNSEDIVKAHKFSINHKEYLMKDKICGCFYCLKIFNTTEIEDWIEDKIDETALCPYCGIDSVIGEGLGYPITEDFLKAMKNYWF